MLIEECVEKSTLKALDGATNSIVMDRLLEHSDQKFRLYYVLGSWKELNDGGDDEEYDHADAATTSDIKQDEVLESAPSNEQDCMINLSGLLSMIRKLAESIKGQLQSYCTEGVIDKYDSSDTFQEAASYLIGRSHLFHEVVALIMNNVRERFFYIEHGILDVDQTRLPRSWSYSTTNRRDFLKSLRPFTGNDHHYYGRLLTPLVAEIRISGPFFVGDLPEPQNNLLNLIDSVGIGHTASDSFSDATSHIISELDRVDGLLIVDNAAQPMQKEIKDLLSEIAANGHLEKVLIAFTHMDQLVDPNFADSIDRKRHVFRSLQSAVENLKKSNNLGVIRDFEKILDTRTFFFGNLNESSKKQTESKNKQLEKLFLTMRKPSRRADSTNIPIPVYSRSNLEECIEKSSILLLQKWKLRLGLEHEEGIRKEHWATIRALCRRIADSMCESYKNLDPSGDFSRGLMTSISNWLENPISWLPESGDYAGRNAAINNLRQRISPCIQQLSKHRSISQQLIGWQQALKLNGPGSSIRRACEMEFIFHRASPSIISPEAGCSASFRAEVIKIVEIELTRVGAKLEPSASQCASSYFGK